MSVTFYFNDTVRKVYHKDGSLYYSFITHNITENKFVSIYINTADVLEDYRIVIFFIYSCHTHNEGQNCSTDCGGCQGGDCRNETVALLTYMLQHNEHHAAELDQMADNLAKMGMDAAAKTIKESVSDFQKGNMRLGLALTLVKEEMK